MSLLFAQRDAKSDLIPERPTVRGGAAPVTRETALRNSAVWACRRLRADLISTLPADVMVRVDGQQVEVPPPPVLKAPGGEEFDYLDWMYATQQDLDSYGNDYGLITARDAKNRPARIDLVPAWAVTVRQDLQTRAVTYWIEGRKYERDEIWHERQFPVAGLPVGLSPISYAALSISQGLSAQEWALGWYRNGGAPAGILKNVSKDIGRPEAMAAKESYKAAIDAGDVWVTGKSWEFSAVEAQNSDAAFLQAMQATVPDICRYFGCPADLIDAMVSGGGSVTYANITQRNLQFLIMNLGPAIIRRERRLSNLVRRGAYLKLNSDALLRMDPKAVSEMLGQQVKDRLRAPSEARELMNLPHYTDEQLAEFDRLFRNLPAPGSAVTGGSK